MRDTLSSWTENWLVYFGVIFIAFVMFSPNGIVGVFQRLRGLARRDGVGARVTTRSAGTPAPATVERPPGAQGERSEEHTSELQSPCNLVCRLLLEKKKKRLSVID